MDKTAIIVVTHGHFGDELIRSSELIMGKLENIYSISLLEEMDPLDLIKNIQEILNNEMDNYIILTDLFGGSPSNLVSRFALTENVIALSGVNLPMLIEVETVRKQGFTEELAGKLVKSASEGIKDIKKIMLERQEEEK
ncbi:PTS mannose transporter subunit IIAB [Tetragenococcus halophilus subsp. flandriensis]|uniref:PTS sugar transporter subunit IIA n=1 Tax=Tetragenococcus halophilus TaxID=51669 RepID=UPI0023E9C56E|nr:PTS mannose transporter subunit IIA [Tetragenococcus halophilus]GMA08812.1 PTS mannose transporter subunit IIAB [Tetragenococcus halophilus subsp. flandriensis]